MLSPEQAKERLTEWQLPEGKNRLAEGLEKLPPGLRQIAGLMFELGGGSTPEHYPSWQRQQERRNELTKLVTKIEVVELAKVFEVLAPQLATALEKGWALLITTPYQNGAVHKAFRGPRYRSLTAQKIASWLIDLASLCGRYRAEALTPVWLATWGSYLNQGYRSFGFEIGVLLAAVLNESTSQADEVFEILRQSLTGRHEIGGMGRHVLTAMLLSNRTEGWELIEKTLLAAQRQEGLRQSIFESLVDSHPEAFRRMLRLIVDHDLIRFSSALQAADLWFGQFWSVGGATALRKVLARAVTFLDDPAIRQNALDGSDPEAAFVALWCIATGDAMASVPLAKKLLESKSVELRFAAARHLMNLSLTNGALTPSLADEDLRVACIALFSMTWDFDITTTSTDDGRFEKLEQLVARLPAKLVRFEPIVWPWLVLRMERSRAAACLPQVLGARPASRLIPHLKNMDSAGRKHATELIAKRSPWDHETREAVFQLVGDSSEAVRGVALKALEETTLTEGDARRLEGYLARKSGDLRLGVLVLLLKQPDAATLASAGRLLAAKDANQRLAGLEIVRLLTQAKRSIAECRGLAQDFQAKKTKATEQGQRHIEETFKDRQAAPTLVDALGLMNPAERTKPVVPRNLKTTFLTPAAVECLAILDGLIHQHREAEVTYKSYRGTETVLLGTIDWGFPGPDTQKRPSDQIVNLPLAEIWLKWFRERGAGCCDPDGFELVRALACQQLCYEHSLGELTKWAKVIPGRQNLVDLILAAQQPPKLRYGRTAVRIIEWLLFVNPVDAADYLIDAVETAYSLVPQEDLDELRKHREPEQAANQWYREDNLDWRGALAFETWRNAISNVARLSRRKLTPQQTIRLWRLMHWRDEPVAGSRRHRVEAQLLMGAYSQGAARLADVADHLLGPRGRGRYSPESFGLLNNLTQRRPRAEYARWLADHFEIRDLVERSKARILDLELGRGDMPTSASEPAHSLAGLPGVETLRQVLAALGRCEFKGAESRNLRKRTDRRSALSHLAKITFPAKGEDSIDFIRVMKQAVKEKQFPEERLLQLTFLAPQWSKFVESYFHWPNLTEGVYWFLAHMSYLGGRTADASFPEDNSGDDHLHDDSGAEGIASDGEADTSVDSDAVPENPKQKLSAWQRIVLERTPLTGQERSDGAIDVAWFRRTHAGLGEQRWQKLAQAARYAANAAQAKRAKFVGDVLLGKISRRMLVDGIKKKQLKEYVRLLGLLPLAKGDKRDKDLAERCRLLRDYRRYANQLSGLTKPSALLSSQIGMTNLAQTANYPDPLRLEWSVGAAEIKDLVAGQVTVTRGGVAVTLALNELSVSSVTAVRNGKPLKSIPTTIKKDKRIAELITRAAELKRQAASIQQSLEEAMCRGDLFSGEELQAWCGHALLAPLMARLAIVGEGSLGYPHKGGTALRNWQGQIKSVEPREMMRIAHPNDLLAAGAWHDWQRECFQAERVQPFKQIFRELYVITRQEEQDGAISHRYDGQQVQPKHARAVFGNRGWNTGEEIFKVFHDLGLAAEVYFQSGVMTPLEVECATLAGVAFRRRDGWKPIDLSLVPPRLFSEVMRDLDLVVSVAHAGGVDPEASASTVEMRSALLQETCSLLDLQNVRFKSSHLVIQGELAEYSVHLGSGIVHRMPGGSLCIVPVHSQHRGRMFLPFADDDPRTAEIISKVLLLARDGEIKDVSILEQIRR